MKSLVIILIAVLCISCSVEQRIKDHSYTDEWYYYNSEKHQVYQTKLGNKYILIFNEKQTKVKRKYLKVN